ncbi:phage protein [Latilactobacillus sakei]|nr:phage protein [Latilactobacillus sakei]
MYAMETADIKKIDDPIMPVRIKNNPEKADVIDEKNIPAFYFRQKYELDKARLKTDLKAGKPVTGAKLTRETRIEWG